MKNNDEFKDGCRVQLTDDYDGLEEGVTGIVLDYYPGSSYISMNYIKGKYTPYCEDCDDHYCDCIDQEDWSENHSDIDEVEIPRSYLKVISAPEADTLILLI
jgi:hypothetical protein